MTPASSSSARTSASTAGRSRSRWASRRSSGPGASRHAALGDGDRRRRDRCGADGPPARSRDAVRRLRLLRLGPPRHRRRQAALPRRDADPDRAPAAIRRRLLRRPVPLAEPRELLCAHPRPEGRLPGHAADAKGLLVSAIEDANPVLFFEHKHLYRRIKGEVPDERYTIPFGEASVHRAGDDVTVVTWGAMVYTAERGSRPGRGRGRLGRDPRPAHVDPWDSERVLDERAPLLEGARAARGHTHRRLRCGDRCHHRRGGVRAPRRARARMAAPDYPVPFSPALEKAYIPQVDDVAAALLELAAY